MPTPHAVGVIAEYNPFHNGHAYQLMRAREETDADYLIIVMSGNFMQRGTPALLDKYTRAKWLLFRALTLYWSFHPYGLAPAQNISQKPAFPCLHSWDV